MCVHVPVSAHACKCVAMHLSDESEILLMINSALVLVPNEWMMQEPDLDPIL